MFAPMAYPHASNLIFPLDNYRVNSYRFGQKCTYHKVFWGVHLGEDINRPSGTRVKSIGRGRVVYSALHPGTKEKGNWGNIVIIGHKHPKTKKVFYSLYAHLNRRNVRNGQKVEMGKVIGVVGKKNTSANGWWPDEHLHFAIYIGPWKRKVLPGYWREDQKLTELSYWEEPTEFVKKYQ
ncbi:M23 family metallopeptidase [Candidatus Falkowbacteria bacterium]|nr:M23 family metallopeptidase [Candidatus Falkowbacteria bacterium]